MKTKYKVIIGLGVVAIGTTAYLILNKKKPVSEEPETQTELIPEPEVLIKQSDVHASEPVIKNRIVELESQLKTAIDTLKTLESSYFYVRCLGAYINVDAMDKKAKQSKKTNEKI